MRFALSGRLGKASNAPPIRQIGASKMSRHLVRITSVFNVFSFLVHLTSRSVIMKQVARLWFIAVLFAVLLLPVLAAERVNEAPIFYQGCNIGSCTAESEEAGSVTVTYLYYWDIAGQENRVAKITHKSYKLKSGFYGNVRKGKKAVTVDIMAHYYAQVATNTCKV